MERTLQILVVGHDANLPNEFHSALAGIPNWRAVVHHAPSFAQAVEPALSRYPQMICLQMGDDDRELIAFTRDMQASLSDTAFVALYSPERSAQEGSDSARIIEVLRSNVRDFLRRPVSSTELREILDRLFLPRIAKRTTASKVLSFISNKGGVGKSTLAVSTACALAKAHPSQVLLIDASLQLGVCALMLDLIPQATITDAVREKDRLDETLLRRLAIPHSCGLYLLAAPADAFDASDIDEASISRVLNVARRAFDYVVIDTFPLLDSIVIAILDVTDIGYIVMQGLATNVIGIAKYLPVLKGVGFPEERQHIILNQNYRGFPGNLTVGDIESRIGRTIDYVFPYKKQLLIATNTGQPYVLKANRWFGFGASIAELVDDIEAHQQAGATEPIESGSPGASSFAAKGSI
jgi:pilus assembly protein CpaE